MINTADFPLELVRWLLPKAFSQTFPKFNSDGRFFFSSTTKKPMIAKFIKIAVLFIVFLMVAGASAYLTLTFIIKSEDTVIVPDLVGKNVVTALELLTDLQLNTKVNGSEYNQRLLKTRGSHHEPEPGSEFGQRSWISELLYQRVLKRF